MSFSHLKSRLSTTVAPYNDVLLFTFVLLSAHFVWKFTIIGEETGGDVSWLGLDVTAPFNFMAHHTASVCFTLVSWLKDTVHFNELYTIYYDNQRAVTIVWACTPFKQCFIFGCIILCSHGKFLRKLWFIPLGFVFIYLFNILRITLIILVIETHHEWFTFLHEHLLKYIFYGMIFLLWVWWTEKLSGKKKETKSQFSESSFIN